MKTMTLSVSLALAATQLTAARPLMIDGTVCRMNRAVDRLIIGSDAGSRVRIAVGHSVPIRMNAHNYDRADLRPGDRVHIAADRSSEGLVARGIDVTMRVDDALVDSIFRSHRMLTGRFAIREAKTEFFSMRLPGQKYVRVDAKSAYGPNGRVRVSKLRSGDLIEVRGSWPSKNLLQASSINVITDHEPSFCTTAARRGEMSGETHAREADEQKFLDKSAD
ncbi:MAG TPA: hypothetical protein VKL19_18270 [Thermoanaerobaculia bacterium]|nr:hypothetical protein [Thermoanaerobaculia bacterium]